MKHLALIIAIVLSCLKAGATSPETVKTMFPSNLQPGISFQSDTLLLHIQDRIYKAFSKDLVSHHDESLKQLSSMLGTLYKEKPQHLMLYWRAYLTFYSSLYYLIIQDNKSGENEINRGIEMMNPVENKSSEDYALLARLQSLSISFNTMKAMYIAEDIKKNINSSISLDSTNIRAYYVFASYDFHTPEEYGGGRVTEKYLLKAISMPEQKIKNDFLPSWGKEESYELLINFYIKKEKWDQAKKYFNEGLAAFPDSYIIKQFTQQLAGK